MIAGKTWHPLEPGEIVADGDAMRIGDTLYPVFPCLYDQAGQTCCVGVVVDERSRWYRAVRA